jgi:actin-related protein
MLLTPNRTYFRKFFEESLAGVKDVLQNQLELAESRNHRVQKVILTGGFGQSPSLQSYLRTYLRARAADDRETELVVPTSP